MPHFVCSTCSTQFAATDEPPPECPICSDPRQYVPGGEQRWTTLDAVRAEHVNAIRPQGELTGILPQPKLGIGQRALLVPHRGAHLLWDCVALLDDQTEAYVRERGGLTGIAISHPHYHSAMVEWADAFDCPIHLHALDEPWVMRPDARVEFWEGDSHDLGDGLALHRIGGHFPGYQVLHDARGDGTLFSGDLPLPVADSPWLTFMWSYPNMIPLPGAEVERIAARLAELRFETLHAAFADMEIHDASRAVADSAARYVDALRAVPDA